MNFSAGSCFALVLIIVAVFLSGCSGSAPPEPSVTGPQATPTVMKTTGTPTAITAHQPATTVQVNVTESPVRVFNGDYRWVEYRENNSVTMPPNPRSSWVYNIKMERSSENCQGSPAIHYKITTISDYPELANNIVTVTKDGSITNEDSYYDTSTNRFLKATWSETIKGVLKPTGDFSAYYSGHYREDSPGGSMGIMPFGEMNITLTYAGVETITVPAGTYQNARKYVGGFKDGTPITFWVAPGIPVPIRYEFPNKYQDGVNPFNLYELEGWG